MATNSTPPGTGESPSNLKLELVKLFVVGMKVSLRWEQTLYQGQITRFFVVHKRITLEKKKHISDCMWCVQAQSYKTVKLRCEAQLFAVKILYSSLFSWSFCKCLCFVTRHLDDNIVSDDVKCKSPLRSFVHSLTCLFFRWALARRPSWPAHQILHTAVEDTHPSSLQTPLSFSKWSSSVFESF